MHKPGIERLAMYGHGNYPIFESPIIRSEPSIYGSGIGSSVKSFGMKLGRQALRKVRTTIKKGTRKAARHVKRKSLKTIKTKGKQQLKKKNKILTEAKSKLQNKVESVVKNVINKKKLPVNVKNEIKD